MNLKRVDIAASLACLVAPWLGGQEPLPAFASQAAAITVDVVVLDDAGLPVRGLAASDFTIFEDGHRQTIVGFEAHDAAVAQTAQAAPAAARVATNTDPDARPSAVFALLIDDVGLSPGTLLQLKPAIQRWLLTRAQPRDEITLMTTSGEVWWSDLAGRGREDLLRALERVTPKRPPLSAGSEWMSDWEAFQIAVNEASISDAAQGARAAGQATTMGVPGDPAARDQGPTRVSASRNMIDRVARRWMDSHACHPNDVPFSTDVLRFCRPQVIARAQELLGAETRRAHAILETIARLAKALTGVRERKSILLFSESLLRDSLAGEEYQRAIAAAQQSNTVVYFTGAQGLKVESFYGAGQRSAATGGDLGTLSMEETVLATAGGDYLADETGGVSVTSSNDLGTGLERMGTDASGYYLLGYQPEKAPDDRWHKLEVKVARPGVKVRARHRYFAATAPSDSPASGDAKRRPVPTALWAGAARGSIPVRMVAYVQGPDGVLAHTARVLVGLEIDSHAVAIQKSNGQDRASLDLTVLSAGPKGLSAAPAVDQRLDMTLGPTDVSGWWVVLRDIHLPPGVSQVRAHVRDRATGAFGMVSQSVSIPNLDTSYLSTPLLTNRTLPALKEGEAARLVPASHRSFPAKRPLYCEYEVFSFGGQALPGNARVTGAYILQAADGRVVDSAPPTVIESDGVRMVRRVTFATDTLEPGAYELTLTVQDQLAQRTMVAHEAFTLEAPPQASTAPASR